MVGVYSTNWLDMAPASLHGSAPASPHGSTHLSLHGSTPARVHVAPYPGRLGGEKPPGIHCMRMRENFSKFSVKFYVKSQSQKLACTEVNYRWSIR